MFLSKPTKILIGLATLWVTLYPLLFLFVWLLTFFGMLGFSFAISKNQMPFIIFPFFAIFPLHCLTILLIFGLEAFYLVHVIKNLTASETVRILLGVGTFFIPFIAMPLYYYLFIWLDEPPLWAKAPPLSNPQPSVSVDNLANR